MLATFIMTMRGTPYYYNGDELGMTNINFKSISDYRDMSIHNEYQHQKDIHGDTIQFLKRSMFESRDNGRTPFQWNDSKNAGFTTGTPWISVNPNYITINAEAENKDPNSCLNYFRKLVSLRRDNPVLVYGKYALLDKDNPDIYAYTRTGEGKKFLILLNFSKQQGLHQSRNGCCRGKSTLANYPGGPVPNVSKQGISLRPYEALIYQLQ